MFRRHIFLGLTLGIISLTLLAVSPEVAQAASPSIDFTPEVPFPGFSETTTVGNDFIGEYIKSIFVYFIWTVGLLTTFMIVYGGVKWVSAAGNPGRINDARETINNAVIGLIIALTSVLLLNVINPNFTKLGLPDISKVGVEYFEGVYAPEVCPTSADVDCNKLFLVDKESNPETYCMGAKCKSRDNDQVCSLTKFTRSDGKEIFRPGWGCTKEVEAVYKTATTPEQPLSYIDNSSNTTPIKTMKFHIFPNSKDSCGYTTDRAEITGFCPGNNECYMVGLKAQFPRSPIRLDNDADLANNFLCSPD